MSESHLLGPPGPRAAAAWAVENDFNDNDDFNCLIITMIYIEQEQVNLSRMGYNVRKN